MAKLKNPPRKTTKPACNISTMNSRRRHMSANGQLNAGHYPEPLLAVSPANTNVTHFYAKLN